MTWRTRWLGFPIRKRQMAWRNRSRRWQWRRFGVSLPLGQGVYLFPSDKNPTGHQTTLKTVWQKTLRRAKIQYFWIYDLRSTYATRLSAGGVGDEWVTQMLRQGDAKVFKKYSQMKLQMKREALEKINRHANRGEGF